MAVYSAADGSVRWHKDSLKYSGPCILHNDLIITNANSYSESAGAFRLMDGEPFLMPDSITGELRPWKLTRAYGCNTVIASENLLTFRSGAAGFYDLLSHSGTGNFGGFKSGCTSNLVVANGVLNAPDYTRTCSCAYQNQTSLALVHMPDVEMWSISGNASIEATNARIRRLGINFGAPGDRRDEEGLMWLEYPVVAGDSPPLHVTLNSDATPYRHHSSRTPGAELPWILASGVTNVSDLKISMSLQEQSHLAEGIPLAHAADDAEESPSGAVDLSSSDLELVDDDGAQIIGLRFENLALARGATIRSAHIQFTCDETSDGAASLLISAQDAGNAIRFREEPHDLSSRPRTPDEVVWTPDPWSKVDEAKEPQRTPDLVQLVQAVINRPDWEPGNAIAFLISGSGKRVARANKGGAARLVIDADQTAPQPATTTPATPYRVRLFFAAPASPDAARQAFQVLVQGQPLEDDIELDPTGPPEMRQAIRTIDSVPIGEELHVQFIPREGTPTLSGIEIVSENP